MTDQPTLIVLGGLPGTGKTSVAREVAGKIAAVFLRIDSIERPMFAAGWDVQAEGYRVAQAVAADNLRLGRTVIADCVNPWPLTRDEWRSVGERAGVRVLEVELVCSDVVEHRRRVESRVADIAGHRDPTWQEVLDRDYRPWNREHLVIDTARLSLAESADAILSKL
jgi:predicted kinase